MHHGLYVWQHYITTAEASRIAVKAHSAGGAVTRTVMSKFASDFKRRVFANAFTGVNGASYSESMVDYAIKVRRRGPAPDKKHPTHSKLLVAPFYLNTLFV